MTDRAPLSVVYETLANALETAEVSSGVAEIHGIVCGAVCAGGRTGGDWRAIALGPERLRAETTLAELLQSLYRYAEAQLAGGEFDFQPLLPPDSVTVPRRIEALADWCRGFLLGIGMARGADAPMLSPDTRELLDDLAGIAEAEPESGDESEESERALEELTEYLRVGTQFVYDELHSHES